MAEPSLVARALAGLLLTALAAQPAEITVNELIAVVRAAIVKHESDKSLAKSLHKITVTQKVPLRVEEELESEGAGLETVAALDLLIEASKKKPDALTPPPFESPARPSIEEQKSFFHLLDVNAMHYAASLPDFICTQTVRRYQLTPITPPGADRKRGQPAQVIGAGFWVPSDVLTVKLSYFENREKYELILVNGHKTKENYETAGGAIAEGDFGTTLLEIFTPETGTKFQWDHWTHLRKRLTRVYAFRTGRARSHYKIAVGQGKSHARSVVVGRKGFIYADDATQMVMRIVSEAVEIPLGFPVTAQYTILDYDYANVGDKKYLLPLRADERMYSAHMDFKNVVDFRDYRKFTGESTISFDVPDTPDTPAPDKK